MEQRKLAIITGADGGMGTEITREVAKAGYRVVMACYHPEKGRVVCEQLKTETGNTQLEVEPLGLSSLPSVAAFAEKRLQRGEEIALLMNNAGTLECGFSQTQQGLERTVSVNYVGPYLLTRKLLPLMHGEVVWSIWSHAPMPLAVSIFLTSSVGGVGGAFGVFLSIAIPSWR